MSERQTCADCRKLSPATETNYSLIGAQHGWRLTRRLDAHGERIMEWRCPECWRAYKATLGDKAPSSGRVRVPEREPGASAGSKPKSGKHAVAERPTPAPPRRTRGH